MPPKISVAMATYNGEKYIQEQLNSLAEQTVLPHELVVGDDGSSDATVSIIEEFAFSAPFPVRLYINKTNLGFSDNFLKVAALCSGEWIAFCDQDDVWFSNKFERVLSAIRCYRGDKLMLVAHSSLLSNQHLELTGQKTLDFKKDKYTKSKENYGLFGIHGFSLVFRANLLNDSCSPMRPRSLGSTSELIGHDQWISMLANATGDIAYIAEPLAIWRRHETSLSGALESKKIRDMVKKSVSAISPDPYIMQALYAKECADAFQKISKIYATPFNNLLIYAGNLYLLMSVNLFMRGKLYEEKHVTGKLYILWKLLIKRCYFGSNFYSVGWKSFLKDSAFAVGLIGQIKK